MRARPPALPWPRCMPWAGGPYLLLRLGPAKAAPQRCESGASPAKAAARPRRRHRPAPPTGPARPIGSARRARPANRIRSRARPANQHRQQRPRRPSLPNRPRPARRPRPAPHTSLELGQEQGDVSGCGQGDPAQLPVSQRSL